MLLKVKYGHFHTNLTHSLNNMSIGMRSVRFSITFSSSQVVSGHVEGHHVQLSVLVRPDHHLHHGYHSHQRLLYGIPGGVFLFPAVRRGAFTQAHQRDSAVLGLSHRLQRLRHHHEERLRCEFLKE